MEGIIKYKKMVNDMNGMELENDYLMDEGNEEDEDMSICNRKKKRWSILIYDKIKNKNV
jgi:glycine cleavage system pyridoxal-binding protein P